MSPLILKMQSLPNPVSQELVLIGGGHSHAIVLRMLGMKPLPGVQITLITEASDTPYSGMLPGHVAGFYTRDECHIDLRTLCQFANVQFYRDRAIGLDLTNNQVICANHPPVHFDLLSIDIGSTPKLPSCVGDLDTVLPAKPVDRFLKGWNQIIESIRQNPEAPVAIGIVGGGAGGVELALTMQHRLLKVLSDHHQPASNLKIHLFQRDAKLLPKHNNQVSHYLSKLLVQRGIHLHLQEEVCQIEPGHIYCKSGLNLKTDHIVWVTQASAPDWLAKAGLKVDEDGFVLVDDTLRSLSHPQVFAAGDVATMVNHPRPKAGVFAVRQGKPLFQNLCRTLQAKPLKPFHPQQQYLSLIGTGDGSAIASRGSFSWHSRLLWQWKDQIDRKFMERFRALPLMGDGKAEGKGQRAEGKDRGHREGRGDEGELQREVIHQIIVSQMRCSGCGAKVGSGVLTRVLQRIQLSSTFANSELKTQNSKLSSVLLGLNTPDDAAVIQIPAGKLLVQTVDYLPSLIDDPFIFGQISANHALSDLFAMGAQPHSALAIATVPYAEAAIVEETLFQLLSGAVKVLHQAKAELIGGHTTAGQELAFGLSCNGLADSDRLLKKGGIQPGQVLILTKAIGTGALFAAQMQLKAKGSWIDGAIESMLRSNQDAAQCLMEHGATACTDVTGFGLMGHLIEMIRASEKVSVNLALETIPLLDGALPVTQLGITSSLYPQNSQAMNLIENVAEASRSPIFPLLFDPQTSGGLLAAVPQEMGDRCLSALKSLGYSHSAIIGHTSDHVNLTQPIRISS